MSEIIDMKKYTKNSNKESLNYCTYKFSKTSDNIENLKRKKFALFKKQRLHQLNSKNTELRIVTLAYTYLLEGKFDSLNKAVMAALTVVMIEADRASNFYRM